MFKHKQYYKHKENIKMNINININKNKYINKILNEKTRINHNDFNDHLNVK